MKSELGLWIRAHRKVLPQSPLYSFGLIDGFAVFHLDLSIPQPTCAPAWLMSPEELRDFHVRWLDYLDCAVRLANLHSREMIQRSDAWRSDFGSGRIVDQLNKSWDGRIMIEFDLSRGGPSAWSRECSEQAALSGKKTEAELAADWEHIVIALRASATTVYAAFGALWRRGGFVPLSVERENRLPVIERMSLSKFRCADVPERSNAAVDAILAEVMK